MWTVIGAIVSGLLGASVLAALLGGEVRVQGIVVALAVAVCLLPLWIGRKLDARRKQP